MASRETQDFAANPPNAMTTITCAEAWEAQRHYIDAYDAGLTTQPCTWCNAPVVERDAEWCFYPGSGVILHPWCAVCWQACMEGGGFLELALTEYRDIVDGKSGPSAFGRPAFDGYVDQFAYCIGAPWMAYFDWGRIGRRDKGKDE